MKLPRSLTEEEFCLLLKNTKKLRHRIAFLIAFESGLRISEICSLKDQDIDFKGKRILIRQGKGKKDRITALGKSFKPKFLRYIPINLTARSLQRSFKRAQMLAGIEREGLSFHSLRHSFAVRLLERGMALNELQMLLGHSNLSTTSIYVKARPENCLRSYEKYF
ncbi:MAG: tyrosine-type recombinase/integrase [archaeon]